MSYAEREQKSMKSMDKDLLKNVVERLAGLEEVIGTPPPAAEDMREMVTLSRAILFPGFFGPQGRYHVGVAVEDLHALTERLTSTAMADAFIEALPTIQDTLMTDVSAEYNGDPAAENFSEIIACYPAIKAITNYRIAHELLALGVKLIPRVITEMAHSETGIDIHPGATIGHHFMIDHGTGVVIGETCRIGNNVKLYQGVTLGAKSFPLDAQGNPIKGIARHPILEDDVIVYSNATILGRVTIGQGSIIGANMWVNKDCPPHSKVYNTSKNS